MEQSRADFALYFLSYLLLFKVQAEHTKSGMGTGSPGSVRYFLESPLGSKVYRSSCSPIFKVNVLFLLDLSSPAQSSLRSEQSIFLLEILGCRQ